MKARLIVMTVAALGLAIALAAPHVQAQKKHENAIIDLWAQGKPAFGVYVTRLTVGSRCFQAVTNVGNRPTFGEDSFAVESHILDFEPVDLDEQTPLELEFLLRLRPEITWPTLDALKAQIFKDVARAKRYFRLVK